MANSIIHSSLLSTPLRTSQVFSLELNSLLLFGEAALKSWGLPRRVRRSLSVKNAASASNEPSRAYWSWNLNLTSSRPCLSDVVWPSAGKLPISSMTGLRLLGYAVIFFVATNLASGLVDFIGAFAAMAIMGRVDQMTASKGLSLTVPPFGAVCTVLLATPSAPAAKKYNIFVSQIGCAAIGVLAFVIFGAGWVARSTALAASIAFMIYTGCTHPPAASLPLMFIDGAKYHNLHLWYALFPGATGCILLCLIQEMVSFLKENYKF